MENFTFQNPTKIVFGAGQISALSELVPAKSRVLLIYGSGSIKQNGVHDQVRSALGTREIIECGSAPEEIERPRPGELLPRHSLQEKGRHEQR